MRLKPDVITVDPGAVQRKQVIVNERFRTTAAGNFFLDLVRTGMMMAVPDAHRNPVHYQPHFLMVPVDVIDRARQLTTLAFATVEQEKWFIDIPGWPCEVIEQHNND